MRIALVLRSPQVLASDLLARGSALITAGHDVHLVGDFAPQRAAAAGLRVHRWAATRANHRFFTADQEASYRAYDTLCALHRRYAFDLFEFHGDDGVALASLRGRQYAGDFAGVAFCVVQQGDVPADAALEPLVRRWMHTSCLALADVVTASEQLSDLAWTYPVKKSIMPASTGFSRKISVIIPVYNHVHDLAESIASVRASGDLGKTAEVIVIDDGSTEPAAVATIDAVPGVDAVRHLPHRGLPAARNAALRMATGDYLLPLDADDLLADGFLGLAAAALDAHPELAYAAGHVRNFGTLTSCYVPLGHIPGLSVVLNTYPRATALFRREALLGIGGYDESLPIAEDWDLYLRLAEAGCRGEVLPLDAQLYRRHEASMTFNTSSAQRSSMARRFVARFAPSLPAEQLASLLQVVTAFWKDGYEPSASSQLLAERDGRE